MSNTKEKILQASFHLLSKSHLSALSLSAVAQEVGISKTALYRHFSNKKDLLDSMKTTFFNSYADFLKKRYNTTEDGLSFAVVFEYTVKNSIIFFCKNPDFFSFLLISIMSDPLFPLEVRDALIDRHISSTVILSEYLMNEYGRRDLFLMFFYITNTSISFIFQKNTCFQAIDEIEFADRVYTFIQSGWTTVTPIDEKRKKELDDNCAVLHDEIAPESFLCKAIAQAIEDAGFPNLTIEKIAKKAGMAKSSLYMHVASKDDLYRNLILNRLTELLGILDARKVYAKNFSEQVYIRFITVVYYFLQLPSVLTVFGWMRSQLSAFSPSENDIPDFHYVPYFNTEDFYKEIVCPDFGFLFTPELLEGWITMLAVSLVIYGQYDHITETQIIEEAHGLFLSIEKGVARKMILEVK